VKFSEASIDVDTSELTGIKGMADRDHELYVENVDPVGQLMLSQEGAPQAQVTT